MTTPALVIGQEYVFRHVRKGQFVAKVASCSGDFVDVLIVTGAPRFMASENAKPGDVITVRLALMTWTATS